MQFTTYYRNKVWERFKDEADKSGLVNRLLEKHYGGFSEEPVTYRRNARMGTPPERAAGINSIELPPTVVRGSDFVPKPPDPETGYPCCLGKRPCKHWQWDGNKSAYVNSLTGKEREVAF